MRCGIKDRCLGVCTQVLIQDGFLSVALQAHCAPVKHTFEIESYSPLLVGLSYADVQINLVVNL